MSKPFNIFDFLPSHFQTADGTFLKALLTAISDSQGRLVDMVQAGIDQQFLTTATGKYLLYLGEQQGFVLPPNSGLDIRALRALVPIAVASPKQVTDTLNALVKAFYGPDKLRTTVSTELPEPYALADGDDLSVETEAGKVTLGLSASVFSDIGNVSAAELATFINTAQSVYVADAFLDYRTNQTYLRIASKTIGVGSKIRVVGGTAQNVLRFPKIVKAQNAQGTTWNVSKIADYSDLTTIQWDGNDLNPAVYLVKPGDIATIRGLTGDAAGLNGSYVVQDSGYDYIKVLNTSYTSLSGTFTQSTDTDLVFTSQDYNGIYDLSEYAIITETENDTVSMTVPAVPPLARRFTQGSAHLHGAEVPVIDFTRSSITVDVSLLDAPPADTNSVIFVNSLARPNFASDNTYKVSGSNHLFPQVTYFVDQSQTDYGFLPWTNIQPVDQNAIWGDPRSGDLLVKFPYPHGLKYLWAFTLQAESGDANITTSLLNGEHVVKAVVDDYTVMFSVNDSAGVPIRYHGYEIDNVTVSQYTKVQPDGADFYITLPSIDPNLVAGQDILLDPNIGQVVQPYLGRSITGKPFEIVRVDGTLVNLRTGLGAGPFGTVLTGAMAVRSNNFGGNVSYFFDKTTDRNKKTVLSGLNAVFTEFTKSANPQYVGSYIFDPIGAQYQLTVSSQISKNAKEILKGANPIALFVESVADFPTSGQLVIDYGTDRAEGPINFLSTIQNSSGNSQILIDPAYRFKFSHDPGALIWTVISDAPFAPDQLGTDFPAYVTGTAQARNTLHYLVELLVASGIFIDFNVLLPALQFSDPSIEPFE